MVEAILVDQMKLPSGIRSRKVPFSWIEPPKCGPHINQRMPGKPCEMPTWSVRILMGLNGPSITLKLFGKETGLRSEV